jgi:hypothetical protein
MAVQRWSDSFSIASHGTTVETIFTSLIRWRALARAPEVASLTFSQILRFVRRSPVASCLGSSLPGRKLSRLTPTNVGTPCAFLTGP